MVYWFVSPIAGAVLQLLLDKSADLVIYKIGSNLRSDTKLRKLISTLAHLQCSIHDTEDTQVITDQAWQNLQNDSEDARYDVEDLLDKLQTVHMVGRQPEQQIEALQEKLDDLLKQHDKLQGRHLETMLTKVQTTSFVDKSRVFGMDTDITHFLKMIEPLQLQTSSIANNVVIIPILGVIGVGKTTLAQLAYNHDYNPKQFDTKIWVSVPVVFDVPNLTRSIIEEVHRQSSSSAQSAESHQNLESLQHQLSVILKGKKFLLVLDDLWKVERNDWDLLLNPLNHAEGGSKIIVTTGSRLISKLVATDEEYELKNSVSPQNHWKMLKQEAFRDANRKTDPEVERIGLEIARTCECLPLTAKIVSGKLPTEDNPTDWRNILESNIWSLSAIKREAALALRWNFRRLALRLRQFLAYCSMFPQNYEFEKHKISRMWMAVGFIICDQEGGVPEEIGSKYISHLRENLFFEKKGKKYIIQAAVHKLVQSVSSHKYLRLEEISGTCPNEGTKHLSLFCVNIEVAVSKVFICRGLRSLILFVRIPTDGVPLALFGLGMLRVLDLSGTLIKDLTASIGKLIHLRFLDLSNSRLKLLPETMKELRALQTLILANSPHLLRLPNSTCKLISLLHLQLGGNNMLSSMPSGIGKLISVRTIDEFIVGSKKGQINELKNLNNIQGSLCVKQLENVEDSLGDLDADLASKKNLESLELQWSFADDALKCALVLDRLVAPHDSLKQLVFRKYGGRMFPQWVSSSVFSKLETICIYDCENCELLPALGKLPKLRFLKITRMDSLEKVDKLFAGEDPGFPSLEAMEFREMPKLDEWVGVRDNDMARLRELVFADCPQLINIPSLHQFQGLEELKFEVCPLLPLFTEEKLSNSVKSLFIGNCSLLQNRYRIGCSDRIKIAHIPVIRISLTRGN